MSLLCLHYSCISKLTKVINVVFKTETKGTIQHLAIDVMGA
ncbi:Mobile element protein [Candidatus Enterovibrio altilux]|uniref:Mobile element protein n=1 Tax=Candidatus Enterovibrio altilux TaxID=1927128 RepID=A0A291B8U9_9GAMM|nr:Mobile element protein [Candidatus Enterovibrio luxaltus]